MNPTRPNDAAVRIAREMIAAGEINTDEPWTFTADDAKELLGDPPDWERFASGFLCLRTGVSRKTKGAYAFPIGKDGKVYRSALLSARSRATQDGHRQAFNLAGELLAEIDGSPEEGRRNVAENMALVGDRPAITFALDAIPLDSLPEIFVQLLPYTGDEYVTALDGRRLRVSTYSLEEVARAFDDRVNDIVLDYEHNTYNPFVPEGSRAAGWIRELAIAAPGMTFENDELAAAVEEYGPGIYARVSLTKSAAEKIKAREYRYLSPVVRTNDEDTVLEVVGSAITNDPALDGMMPLAAKKTTTANTATDAAGAVPNDLGKHREETDMDNMDLKTLSALLGRPVGSVADAQAEIGKLTADRDKFAAAEADLQEMRAKETAREAEAAADAAIADGRISENQKTWAVNTFTSDRASWDAYIAATAKGTFTAKSAPPEPGRVTPEPEDPADGGASLPGTSFALNPGIRAFGKKVTVNQDELTVLKSATETAKLHFGGDVARGLRAARR